SMDEAREPVVSPAQATALWERFHQELRAFVTKRVNGKVDVDDLLQAIFLRIHTTLSRPIEIIHPRGWIFQVARSVMIDHLRAAQTKSAHLSQVTEGSLREPGLAPMLGEGEEAEETLIGCLQVVLDALPQPYRDALVWTELQNMSQRDAATKAGISVSGMKSRVQRGRAQLKDALLACCDVELDRRRHPIACERKSSSAESDNSSVESSVEEQHTCSSSCS
ncbi:MAG TPA: sigma-70 family RNA polymerase sigma factor, partial [Kofleriaceae bacterium]|nr:sigma-70 family RNA polymerase sigma factor [Kofleriaceae bacterium]